MSVTGARIVVERCPCRVRPAPPKFFVRTNGRSSLGPPAQYRCIVLQMTSRTRPHGHDLHVIQSHARREQLTASTWFATPIRSTSLRMQDSIDPRVAEANLLASRTVAKLSACWVLDLIGFIEKRHPGLGFGSVFTRLRSRTRSALQLVSLGVGRSETTGVDPLIGDVEGQRSRSYRRGRCSSAGRSRG